MSPDVQHDGDVPGKADPLSAEGSASMLSPLVSNLLELASLYVAGAAECRERAGMADGIGVRNDYSRRAAHYDVLSELMRLLHSRSVAQLNPTMAAL